ncbi:MAG: hypothetical protein JWQ17_1451 [Tardiphaga sp.]|jgi:hypothetical protein|nr:hypothetical protein [Tardiphaga sp.]
MSQHFEARGHEFARALFAFGLTSVVGLGAYLIIRFLAAH